MESPRLRSRSRWIIRLALLLCPMMLATACSDQAPTGPPSPPPTPIDVTSPPVTALDVPPPAANEVARLVISDTSVTSTNARTPSAGTAYVVAGRCATSSGTGSITYSVSSGADSGTEITRGEITCDSQTTTMNSALFPSDAQGPVNLTAIDHPDDIINAYVLVIPEP